MHRLKSKSTVYRFRLAALLLCTKYLLLTATCGVLLTALILNSHPYAMAGCVLAGLVMFIAFLQWLIATRTGCPLCMTPVLAKKQCVPHRQARAVFGNHRLRVALTVLFRGTFRCPYCYELTAVKPRRRNRHSSLRGARS